MPLLMNCVIASWTAWDDPLVQMHLLGRRIDKPHGEEAADPAAIAEGAAGAVADAAADGSGAAGRVEDAPAAAPSSSSSAAPAPASSARAAYSVECEEAIYST